ncbi:MAG: 3'(2'),5'-bisphosphate nucleotidase [Rhodobacteraceae bacterium]|nr:MAG: 3'(2'),5'-bisphosphate nucleotidase [Paracoccaceae bacterium]
MRDHAMTATLVRLAREAGAAVMAVYARDFEVAAKADESPVTEADLAADRVIVDGLAAAWPDIPVVTEERAESHDLGAGRTHFLVDPLDGTKEFVHRRGDFTVNIALIEDGRPVAGVVFAPAVGRLFRTDPAGGAVEEREDGTAAPIAVADADNAALRVVASKSHRDAATDAYVARYSVGTFRSAGSSLKFCLVAAGEADLYPRLGRTMEWDTAAADAVLRAAGGRTLVLGSDTPLLYGKCDRANPFFVACGRGVRLSS